MAPFFNWRCNMAFEAYFPKITLASGDTDTRRGDGIVMQCAGQYMIVDAFEGGEATNGIKSWLKSKGAVSIDIAVLTHPHWDHYNGMLQLIDAGIKIKLMYCYDPLTLKHGCDGSGNGRSVQEDMDNAVKVIRRIQAAGGIVKYIDHGGSFKFGDITWRVYRSQPQEFTEYDDGNAWAFINDGSLVIYSPETQLLLGGDGPCDLKYALAYFNAPVSGYDIAHHGNNCSRSNAESLKDHGCVVAWESCVEGDGAGTTDWTAYGARRVKQQGISVWMQDEPIYISAAGGRITFKQGSKVITKVVSYQGTVTDPGWKKNAKGWWYKYPNGSWPVGWAKLAWSKGTDWFFFDGNGYMVTGWLLDPDRNGWFYLDPKSGAMWASKWLDYKNKRCYLKASGRAAMSETIIIDGKEYTFDKDCYLIEAAQSSGASAVTTVTGKINQLSESRKQFVISIANYVRKYASQYGIKVHSPIIAQAIHESGWGESNLSANYHNYFGLKCGTKWTGKSVNMATQEEYSAGTLTNITANFRAYNSMEEGVKGYFEFIQLSRYANLKGVTDPRQYLENIKNDGYATGSQYVEHNMTLISEYSLTQFDGEVASAPAASEDPVQVMIEILKGEVGYVEKASNASLDSKTANAGSNNYTKYGKTMHELQPGNMDFPAAWCDAFFDFCVLQLCKRFGGDAETARAVLCGDFDDYTYASVALYKKAGRWSNTPSLGAQIFFGGSGHTGGVYKISGNRVYTVEGNKGNQVKYCEYNIGDSSIIGYGQPRYELLAGGTYKVTAADMPLIKRGATGSAVTRLQEMLNAAAYRDKNTLEVDGSFGPKTQAQVIHYQMDRGLDPDGEVGPITWGALFAE